VLASLGRFQPAVPLLLRIPLGLVFIGHGIRKLEEGVGPLTDSMARLGVPMPGAAAWVAALAELLGGIFVLVGLFTRWAALALAIVAYVAVSRLYDRAGLVGAWELPLVLLSIAVCLVLSGSGPLSLDKSILHRDL
jgi:putative oxidoreductase